MSLDQEKIIDAIGVESASDCLVLSIIDSWGWDDHSAHLSALQSKLNAYLEFISSGQLIDSYPKAKGKKIRIEVVSRYPIPDIAETFFIRARQVIEDIGIDLKQRVSEVKI